MQFDVRADERSGEFGIGSGTGSSTPDLRRDVVKLLAVLETKDVRPSKRILHIISSVYLTLSATIGPLVARVSAAICYGDSSQLLGHSSFESPCISWDRTTTPLS